MQKVISKNWRISDIFISFTVLFTLLLFTYGLLFKAPYPGFYFSPSTGEVLTIDTDQPNDLKVGDIITRINGIPFDSFKQDKINNPFEDMQTGEKIKLGIQRGAQHLTISWKYIGFNHTNFLNRFLNIWWLAYIFWFIGMNTQLFMRPKDTQWRLFVASNYFTSLFIMFGAMSSFKTWGTAVLMRVFAWLVMAVYIHFHWIFPKSLWRVPVWLKLVFYISISGLVIAQLFLLLPSSLYFVAIAIAFGGSIVLLALHYILQPEYRREVRSLAIAAILSLSFTALIGVVGILGQFPQIGPLAIVALPILPSAYFYTLYRRSMGGLELRTNRVISINFFLILLVIVLIAFFSFLATLNISPEELLFSVTIISLLIAFISIQVFPTFQRFVEKRLLGIKLPARNMVESFSARIVASGTLPELLKLLHDEVFPSLLIRQYIFIQNSKTSRQILLSENGTNDQVHEEALLKLVASFSTENLLPASEIDPSFDWVKLALPLRVNSELIGIWLLGRRDPDDLYPQAELPILQSLANQTAIALSNVIHTEQLKAMYATNINRYEQERGNLARDLHDSVLNEMAAMKMKLDPSSLPPEFQSSYGELINRVREIVGDLRPPMLIYGLNFALNGLADTLAERNHDKVEITASIETNGEWRYPEIVEHNIYRVIQEACENALKYSHAKSINIKGTLAAEKIDIQVTDDGIGFRDEVSLKLDEMLANKHFGLAGMYERAAMIEADIQIASKPGHGTEIRLVWEINSFI